MNAFIKVKMVGLGLGLMLAGASLPAQTISSTNLPVTLPDGNPDGILETLDVSGLTGGILNVQINLNLIAGYNGDLYAYLVGPSGQMAILLNRPGVTDGDTFGSPDGGLDITLDDVGTNSGNIHDYGFGSYSLNGDGQVTGTWGSDGRNIDPQSAPGQFDDAPTTNNLTSFIGGDPNGTWSLFIADLAPGDGAATLSGWSMTLTLANVPEPSVTALIGLSLGGLVLIRRSRIGHAFLPSKRL
jgi:subtilisin-like proprotein convertase family protein